METQSFWKDQYEESTSYPQLTKAIETDVVIVGAGITGMVLAEKLIKEEINVVILESRTVAASTTGNSTGNLYVPVQTYYNNVRDNFDSDATYQIMHARSGAIRHLEKLAEEYDIACDFVYRPWYMYTNFPDRLRDIREEKWIIEKAGFQTEFVQKLPFDTPFAKALRMDHCARFNPYAFVQGLARQLNESQFCQIFEKSRVVDFKETDAFVEVQTGQASVKANSLVLATHVPLGMNPLQLKNFAYRSYVVAAELNEPCPDGNFWELNDYGIVTFSSHSTKGGEPDLMMVAGNHHKVGQEEDAVRNFQEMEDLLRDRIDVKEVRYRWSAQHYAPADGLPFVGKNLPDYRRVFCATGYGTDGLVYGSVAALLIADLLQHKLHPLKNILDSRRLNLVSSVGSVLKENVNVAKQFLDDFLLNKYENEIASIAPGGGKVVELEGDKCAVYKDNNGKPRILSAICPHMKCVVHWNNAEKTWDCPCHGSRFTTEGEVLEGPSFQGLPLYDPNHKKAKKGGQ